MLRCLCLRKSSRFFNFLKFKKRKNLTFTKERSRIFKFFNYSINWLILVYLWRFYLATICIFSNPCRISTCRRYVVPREWLRMSKDKYLWYRCKDRGSITFSVRKLVCCSFDSLYLGYLLLWLNICEWNRERLVLVNKCFLEMKQTT